MLIQALSTALAVQGRLVEAAEILDGAIEGARLAAMVRRWRGISSIVCSSGCSWVTWTLPSRPRRRAST